MRASIIYASQSGNTEKAARFISDGMEQAEQIDVRLFNINNDAAIDVEFVNNSTIVIFGTPTYYANMCWQLKRWFDTGCNGCNLDGKIGGAFATENSPHGGGAELAIMSIIGHMLVKGMLIYSSGASQGMPKIHIGPAIVRDALEERKALCNIFGARLARKAKELF